MIDTAPDYQIEQIHRDLRNLLRSTDTAARHEAFSRLTAGIDELALTNLRLAKENRELRMRGERLERERDAVLEAAIQGVLVYDTEGRIIRANRAATESLEQDPVGMSGDELIRHTGLRRGDGRAVSVEDLPSTRALQGEKVAAERMDAVIGAGGRRNILASASPLTHDGRTFGAVVVWQEITEQVRTIRMLEEEKARLRVIIDSAPEAILVVDAQARIRLANRAAEAINARPVPEGEDYAAYWATMIYDTDGNRCKPDDLLLIRAVKHGETVTGRERAIIQPGGQRREILVNAAPIVNKSGEILGAVGVFQDITDRKKAERALRESEERFRGVFERAGIGIALVDTEGRFLRANPAFERFLGYPAREMQGRNIGDFVHPDDLDSARLHFQETLAGKHDEDHLEKRYIRKDGRTVWGRLATTLLRDPQGGIRFVIGMIEDITGRKENESLRNRAFEQIEHNMEQFAILGDHVRHPLQVLLARADLMEDEETAEKIREQVLRINARVRQLDRGWIESREIREFLRKNELV
ncbi:PAS domain S-box protein [Methanoculleus caldifontis]|nr:PAS domain S-box protein [Methanoculleus sp. Wushi-C6]